jgi:hypothetical protein
VAQKRFDGALRLAIGAAVAALISLSAVPAYAGLAARPAEPVPLSAADQQLVDANPALFDLAGVKPWALRYALNLLAREEALTRDGSAVRVDGPIMIPRRDDARVLNSNPALRDLWRTSPDAATALLSLIRAAASSSPLPGR